MNIQFDFTAMQGSKLQQEYDNNGAHAEVLKMMKRGDKLSQVWHNEDPTPLRMGGVQDRSRFQVRARCRKSQ